MRQIISIIYGVLLIAIWICVMGIVIAVLDSGGPKWLLLAGGFVAVVSTVALVEEFVEWRSGPKAEGRAAHKTSERQASVQGF
jgi:bacteriorhodopsin